MHGGLITYVQIIAKIRYHVKEVNKMDLLAICKDLSLGALLGT
jgi:uncharacterized transporter YbjL